MDIQISLLLLELQVIRDWLYVRDMAETSLNRVLLLLTLKSSDRSCSVEKGALKSFTGKHLCWSLFFKIKLQGCRPEGLQRRCFSTQKFSNEICEMFKNTYFCISM